ncbi:MAG: ABC transporter permease [Lachnospiraceae bacterium]
MQQWIKYIHTELKKGICELPYAFLGTLALCLILGSIAFCASRLLYRQENPERSTVAVVTNDTEDTYLSLAMNMIQNMDSTSLALDFCLMAEEEALSSLSENQVIAILFLPDNLINGILYGTNPPIRVVFSTDNTLSTVFLTEITLAGARLLSSAQADIYAAGELFSLLGRQEELSTVFDTINRFNLNFALNREKLFLQDTTSLGGASGTEIFYAATGILLVLLFITTSFTAILRRENKSFYQLLFGRNGSALPYLIAKWFSLALLLFLFQLLLYGIASCIPALETAELFHLRFRGSYLAFFLVNGLFLSAYANLIFLLSKDVSGGVLITYCISSLMVFCSGGMIPAAFFPSSIQTLFPLFPTFYIHQGMIALLEGKPILLLTPYLVYPIIFFVFCIIVFYYRRRTDRL